MTRGEGDAPEVSAWRHVRAIGLLPVMNTVFIPAALLIAWPPSAPVGRLGDWLARGIGIVLVGAGVALTGHAISWFVRTGGGTLAPWDPARELVRAGAYGYSRNPMKGGLFVVLAGEALLFMSLPIAAWLAVFAFVNVVYIRVSEEPGLRRRFGDAYVDYCERVPRWIPNTQVRPNAAWENRSWTRR
jgi:protein-S-isoprenylcysteine O-methyltransferase Ste14